ncbi:MAG: ATPase [Bacteroidales bacterium]|jgi:N-acetylglucosamine kinase-like BadF-type ATPase|nr:ATPase [Bacteroidales bacterium]
MFLIADSGSTKTTWRLGSRDKSAGTCSTGGINPFQSSLEDMVRLLETEFTLPRTGISKIWFYGAGCAFADKNQIVADALSRYFGASEIHVNSDLLAAAHSLCGNRPGIACIMGTGSNSCHYNGKEIVQNVSPLGYVLGDEGSGSALGKKLLSDILKNRLPEGICNAFFEAYPVTAGEILDNVYRKPFPNRYLAQYARFVAAHIGYPEMQTLAGNCFREFFARNVMQYGAARQLPVHFTGSVAFHFSEIIKKTAGEFGLSVGNISQEPMPGLIQYLATCGV